MNIDKVTIFSIDVVVKYPSIKFLVIIKAVHLFFKGLTYTSNRTIWQWPDIISFGVSSTLIALYGKYYKYGSGNKEVQGLVIGSYEYYFLSKFEVS